MQQTKHPHHKHAPAKYAPSCQQDPIIDCPLTVERIQLVDKQNENSEGLGGDNNISRVADGLSWFLFLMDLVACVYYIENCDIDVFFCFCLCLWFVCSGLGVGMIVVLSGEMV